MIDRQQIIFSDQVFVRRPFFSSAAYAVDKLKDVLCLNVFRNALWLSSPAFYQELEKKNFDFDLMSRKERLTALKFYNRMSFRATPFGSFSGFGLASWTALEKQVRRKSNQALLHLLPAVTSELESAEGQDLADDTLIAVNPTLYKLSNGWRYSRFETEKSGKLSFFVYLLAYNDVDELLLARLNGSPLTLEQLQGYLEELTDATREECRWHILKLLAGQVLLPGNALSLLVNNNSSKRYTLNYSEDLVLPTAVNSRTDGKSWYAGLDLLGLRGLNEEWQLEIRSAIQALDRLAPIPPKNPLDQFREDFERKFGERSVPILEALDPDLGIAYEGAVQPDEHELLKGIEFRQEQQTTDQLTWSPVHKLLVKEWLQNNKRNDWEPIVLGDRDLSGLTPSGVPFPPSFSVLCSLGEEKLIFHHAGGATANALTGRFSAFGDCFSNFCRSVARQEMAANPDIVFAEVVQVSHKKTDNINRRSQVYDHMIPLNSFPVKGSILPADIDVCIRSGEIFLVHRVTGKRIIPRLPTAFNYHHNDMPLFRFLCALQFNSIRANFDFDPGKLFPGLNFYPRIEYRRTVLSLARWHVNKDEIEHLVSHPLSISRLHLFCRTRGIPVEIAAGRGDQQLVFDLSNDEEAIFFLESLHNTSNSVITEFLGKRGVGLNGNDSFSSQYVLSLSNADQVYFPLPGTPDNDAVVRDFLPGSEWVYMKIYATYQSAEFILTHTLIPWIEKHRRRIRQWFFVRYFDSDSHLRIRFRVDTNDVKDIQYELQSLIGKICEAGLVQKAYFDTYHREIERYTSGLITDVEDVFFRGSECVSQYLMTDRRDENSAEAIWPLLHCYRMIGVFFENDWAQIVTLCSWAADALFKEHGGEKKLKRSMDDRFRELRPVLTATIEKECMENRVPSTMELALRRLSVASIGHQSVFRQRLIADMVHMQVNRIFSSGQRQHETFIWHCMLKLALTAEKMSSRIAVPIIDDR